MKTLKIFFSIISLALLLILSAAIIATQVIEPNDYKDKLSSVIKKQTSLEVTFTGDFTLSVFPWLGVSTQQVTLSQPITLQKELGDDWKNISLAKANAINIKVELIPLLTGKIKLDTIVLQQPEIMLITTPSGKSSTDFLKRTGDNKELASDKEPSTNSAKALAALAISGININQGKITIDNRKTKEKVIISELNIQSTDLLNDRSSPLSISGIFLDTSEIPIKFSLNSSLNLDLDSAAIEISNTSLSTNYQDLEIKTNLKRMSYQHPHFAEANTLSITGSAKNIPFSLNSDIITIDIANQLIDIPKIITQASNINLEGQLAIRHWDKTPLISGHLQSSMFDANTLLNTLGVTLTPKKSSALSRIKLVSDFNGTPKGLSLQNMEISLDDSEIKGDVTLTHFASPQYRFDLSLDTINIDDYLPSIKHEETNKQQQQPPMNTTEALLAPVALFDGIRANGVFRAQSIIANNLQFEKVTVSVASDNNTTIIQPSLTLYDGTLTSKIMLERKNIPTLTFKGQLNNVNLEPLLTAADISDQFSGIGNITTDITATEKNGTPSSQGTIKLSVKNGALKGIDLKKILDDGQKTIDKLRGKTANNTTSKNDTEDATRFAAMTATLLLNNNTLSNDDLYMEAPASRIRGKGIIDISQQTIDYIAPVTVVNTNSGQGGRDLEDLKGLTIPVAIKGPLSDPTITPDYSAAIKAITEKLLSAEKEKLQVKLDAEKARLKQKALDKATEKLGLEKEGDTLKDKLKQKLLEKLF